MSDKLRPVLWSVAALLALYVWGNCRESAGAKRALQTQQDQTDNRTIARLAAESFAQESTFQHERDSTAKVIARLRSRVIARDSIVLHDTVQVAQQLDARDTLIAGLEERHAQDSLQALFWKGQVVAYRDTTVPNLTTARDNWKRAAAKPDYLITDVAGGALAGYGIATKNPTVVIAGASTVIIPRVLNLLGKLF